MAANLSPPPGFELADAPDLPPGFEPVSAPAAAGLPDGFEEIPDAAARTWTQRNITDPLGRGFNQLQTGAAVLGGEIGVYSPEEVAQSIVGNAADAALYPVQPDVAAVGQRFGEAQTFGDVGRVIYDDPGGAARFAVNTAVESIPASAVSAAGGLAGAVGGGLTAGPAGAVAGLMGGAGLASGATEFAASIVDVLAERGIPQTQETVAAALQDPEIMSAARQKAALRAAAVGGFDALTAGVAGKIAGPVARGVERAGAGRVAQGLAGVAGETAAQSAGGAAGEAGAQLLSEGQISKPGAVVLEAAAEVPGAAIDVPGAMVGRKAGEIAARPREVAAAAPVPDGFEEITPVAPAAPAAPVAPVTQDTVSGDTEAGASQPIANPSQPIANPSQTNANPVPPEPAPVVSSGGPDAMVQAQTPEPLPPEPAAPPSAPPVDPNAPASAAAQPVAPPRAQVRTPDGSMAIDTDWQVVDAKDLRAADGNLQPRQRDTRLASDAQINEIASRLDPTRLLDSTESDRGAPIVDENGTILSGNGRVAAIELAKAKNPQGYGAYVQAIQARGHDVTGIETPVLVRRVAGLDDTRKREFVVKSNKAATLAMGSGEQAAVDADLIDDDVLQRLDTETDVGLRGASNVPFVRAVLAKLPASEQAAFMGPDGTLSADGARRIEAAVFAKAYGDRDLTNRIVEGGEGGGIAKSLMAAAPAWTKMRAAADPKFDVTPQLVAAVAAVSDMRRRGMKPDAYFGQVDAFARPDPVVETLARAFYNPAGGRAAAWVDVRDFLRGYADAALNQRNATGDLFGGAPKTAVEILRGMLTTRDKKAQAAVQAGGEQRVLPIAKTPKPAVPVAVAAEERLADDAVGITRVPRGGLAPSFLERSFTKDPAVYEQAFRDAGYDPDRARSLPAAKQIRILGDLLKAKFGLAGVADRGIKALDGIEQLLDAYRNLQFMTHALGLPNKAIGLDGRLVLALERYRGRYLGAYAPMTHSIHMPDRSNSFAHEWGHALDHFLLDRLFDGAATPPKSYLLSHQTRNVGLDPKDDLQGAFAHLLNVMFIDKAALAAEIAGLEVKAAEVDPRLGVPTAEAMKAKARLDEILGGARNKLMPSDYVVSAARFDPTSDYWTKPTEMLARAFEAYVAHKVETVGGENAFITKGDQSYLDNADRRLRETFPKDDTRLTIFAAFDDVLRHVQAEALFGSDPVAAKPGAEEKLDPLYWIKQATGAPVSTLPQRIAQEARILRNGVLDLRASAKAVAAGTAANAGLSDAPTIDAHYPIQTRIADMGRQLVYPMRYVMKSLVDRAPEKAQPYLQSLMDHFASVYGSGRAVGETYEEAVIRDERQRANQIAAAASGLGFKNERLTAAETDQLRGVLLGEAQPAAPERIVKLAGALRRIFNDIWRANQQAGIDQGYVRDTGYIPRIQDEAAVFRNPDGFQAQAKKVREIQFDRAVFDEFGFVDVDELLAHVRELDQYRPDLVTDDRTVSDLLKKIRDLRNKIADTERAGGPGADAEIKKLDAELQLAANDLAGRIKSPWADNSARLWRENILQGNATTFDTRGPASNAMKARVLPPEADRLLEGYYLADPIQALQTYVAASAKRREYVRRFGTTGGVDDLDLLLNRNHGRNGLTEAIAANPGRYDPNTPAGRVRIINELTDTRTTDRQEMLLKEAIRAGVMPEDVRTYRDLSERITGRRTSKLPPALVRMSTAIYAYGTLALLSRAAWTSISEPLVAYFHTRSAELAIRNFVDTLSEIRASRPEIKHRRALAETWGITTSPYLEAIINHVVQNGYTDSPRVTRLMSRMFERSGLAGLTNAQRRASMLAGWRWMHNLAATIDDKATPAREREIAKANMRDLGITDERLADVVDWLLQSDTLPTVDEANTKAGRLVGAAVLRFVDRTIQEVKRVDRPALATDPLGRLMFAISSFSYSFMQSVHFAAITRAGRDMKIAEATGSSRAAAAWRGYGTAAGTLAGGFALLVVANFFSSALREALLNGDMWDEKKRKGELVSWLTQLALSRAGILGAVDPLYQAFNGLRYQRDLTGLVAGPHVGYILGASQSLLAPLVPSKADATGRQTTMLTDHPEKKPTNNAQWNAAKASYQLMVPAITALMSSIPSAGPLSAAALSLGMQKASSNSASDTFANTLVGEKDSRKALRAREERKRLGAF